MIWRVDSEPSFEAGRLYRNPFGVQTLQIFSSHSKSYSVNDLKFPSGDKNENY